MALIAPFVAVWISHRKLKPELVKLSTELDHLTLQVDEARALEKKRVREHADQVEICALYFNPLVDDSTEQFEQVVLSYLPKHPDPLNALLACVTNKGAYPIRELAVTAACFRPTRASMNNEDPDFGVRLVPEDLVPLRPGGRAVFAFPEEGARSEVDKLAVRFTDDEDRRWKKDVHAVITPANE
ncbi:hypothetical protein ACWGKS_27050 [Nocardiopsis sp. NPDC055879]